MALLQGVRKILRFKRDPAAEVIPAVQPGEPPVVEVERPAERDAAPLSTTGQGLTGGAVTTEPKFFTSSKTKSVAQLQQSYDEVMGLIRKIGDHLDAQAQRNVHQEQLMERLPDALSVLPEINRQNARLLDVLSEYLDRSAERETSLNDSLSRISESSAQRSETLGMVQRQMDVNNKTATQMSTTLVEFQTALADLGQSNSRSVQVLAKMAANADKRETQLERMLGRTQKWMIGTLVCCGVASVIALAIALMSMVG